MWSEFMWCEFREGKTPNMYNNLIEREKELNMIILELHNSIDFRGAMTDLIRRVKNLSDCECVSIRLEDNGDYPYYVYNGFPETFIIRENSLCAKDEQGTIIKIMDSEEHLLECMCGNIIRGNYDVKHDFFTESGSFWSNNTSVLLANTNEKERQSNTRNYCNSCGYESVALIPIKSKDKNIGLIQLNDKRKEMFTIELINYLELIGAIIGIVILNRLTLSKLEISEKTTKEARADYQELAAELSIANIDLALQNEELTISNIEKEKLAAELTIANIELNLQNEELLIANIEKEKRIVAELVMEQKQRVLEKEMARLDKLNLIGQMAAGIGHEIRNPLTTVRGYLQLLGARPINTPQKPTFELMISELDRANAIITEFLSLAKVQKPNLRFENLNEIITNLFPLLQADAFTQNKDCRIILGDIPDFIPLDAKEIIQLILNICRNGLDSMDTGGSLTIKTHSSADKVILTIEDEGCGIPTEHLEKLGTPFFTTKNQGTGLGLAICYRIALSNNAKIDVSSSPKGTVFSIRFAISCGIT